MRRAIYLISGVSVLVVISLISITIAGYTRKNSVSELYEHYRYPNEDFFGKTLYSEIDYECSADEAKVADMILDRALQVAEYTGTQQEAEVRLGDVGALSRYYYFDKKAAVTQEAHFKFITCMLTEDKGHIWVASTILRYDDNGEYVPGGGRDILTLWYIEYQEHEWQVVQVKEAP